MSASSPDTVLKTFIEGYVQTFRDSNADAFPDKNNVVDAIYYGSKFVNAADGSVPGLAELITGQHPADAAPLTVDILTLELQTPPLTTSITLFI